MNNSSVVHIIGFTGTEGEAAVRFFSNYYDNKRIIVHDTAKSSDLEGSYLRARETFPKSDNQKLFNDLMGLKTEHRLADEYLFSIDSTDLVLLPQDWDRYPANLELVKRHRGPVFLIFDLYYLFFKGIIIGITGTKGKTSLSHLCLNMLGNSGKKAYLSGNDRYSRQVLSNVKSLSKDSFLVLETSNRHLKHSLFSPDIAMITNIDVDHLHEHNNDIEHYTGTKLKILKNSNMSIIPLNIFQKHINIAKGGYFILFSENKDSRGKSYDFPLVYKDDNFIRFLTRDTSSSFIDLNDISPSIHIGNILSLSSLALHFNIGPETAIITLNNPLPIKSRFEYIGNKSDINFIDDTSSTTPYSTIKAINMIKGGIILICGGDAKHNAYEELAQLIRKRVKQTYVLHNDKLKASLKYFIKASENVIFTNDFKETVKKAYYEAKPGDTILLSPACGHFYSNFIKNTKNNLKTIFRLLKNK